MSQIAPNCIQTEEDLVHLNDYIPKDLVDIIYHYVSVINFKWTRDECKGYIWRKDECDTTAQWVGQLTIGIWKHGIVDIFFKGDNLIRIINSHPAKSIISHGHSFMSRFIRILEGEKVPGIEMKRLTYHEVGHYTKSLDPTWSYYYNPEGPHRLWWIFKCDIKLLIEEIKFVINTVITNPNHNRRFFSQSRYQHLL